MKLGEGFSVGVGSCSQRGVEALAVLGADGSGRLIDGGKLAEESLSR